MRRGRRWVPSPSSHRQASGSEAASQPHHQLRLLARQAAASSKLGFAAPIRTIQNGRAPSLPTLMAAAV